jgi:hypothetical protein
MSLDHVVQAFQQIQPAMHVAHGIDQAVGGQALVPRLSVGRAVRSRLAHDAPTPC